MQLIGAPLLPGHSKWSSYRMRCTQRRLLPRTFLQGENSSSSLQNFFVQPFNLPPQHFVPGKTKRLPLSNYLKKKKRAVFFPLTLLVSPSFFGGQWGVTVTVDYGMDCKTFVMFRGGGTGCSALHGNQRKALSVDLNLHSKSPYGADYHTWEGER